MSTVAVIAHSGKSLEGGLPALRKALERNGIGDPLWHEVAKSRQAPEQVRSALKQGADLIFVWGGDGMVQRWSTSSPARRRRWRSSRRAPRICSHRTSIPKHIDAVDVGLNGTRRKLDVGRMNGEMFAVMAGVGFDARVIRDTSPEMKHTFGRSAYVWAERRTFEPSLRGAGRGRWAGVVRGAGELGSVRQRRQCVRRRQGVRRCSSRRRPARDRRRECRGLPVGAHARTQHRQQRQEVALRAHDEGSIDPGEEPQAVLYELDGGDREKKKSYRVDVQPGAIKVCVPVEA